MSIKDKFLKSFEPDYVVSIEALVGEPTQYLVGIIQKALQGNYQFLSDVSQGKVILYLKKK